MATAEERLQDLEERVGELETVEAPLARIKHVWDAALKPAGSFLGKAALVLGPYAATTLVTLFLAGQLAVPGCPGPGPSPPAPVPVPPPNPPAPAVKIKLLVNFLHDANTDTPAWGQLAYAPALRWALAQAGHVVRVYEASQDEYRALNFAPFVARAGGLPAVVLQLPDGTVKGAIKMPGSAADVLKAVHDAGGF